MLNLLDYNRYKGQGKPFFIHGVVTDIPYDSLLGISMTLVYDAADPIDAVFIESYRRDSTTCSIDFTYTTKNNHTRSKLGNIAAIISGEILTLPISANSKIISGSVTVIGSEVSEYSYTPVQINPAYIKYANGALQTQSFNVNDKVVNANNAQFILSNGIASVSFVETADAYPKAVISFSTSADQVIDERSPSTAGIINFGGNPIAYDAYADAYVGTLNLPKDWTVHPVNKTFALISPYSYETCATGEYIYASLGEIDCNVSHSEDFPLPLDACFDEGGTEEKPFYTLNPFRIIGLEAPDKVNYESLNSKH
jgi:hypothetical protein